MIAMAKVEELPGYGNRLRYANKLIVQGDALTLDTETLDLLGDSIGSAGAGTYAAYYAEVQNGYIYGKLVDCDNEAIGSALAVITGGPFFTYTADDGSYALPTLDGVPGAVTLSGTDCTCTAAAPVTNTNENTNPKSEADTPPSNQFSDNTNAVAAPDCVCCPPEPVTDDDDDNDDNDDTVDDDTTDDDDDDDNDDNDDTVDDDTTDDDDDDDNDDDNDDDVSGMIDFEDGLLTGWDYTSGCQLFGVSNLAYGELFPAGDQQYYLYASSGGNGVASCTLTATVSVPAGATQLEISYNFVSQEYEEWVGSQYDDIFTVIIQGAPDYLVNRTVNNIATDNDWLAIAAADAAATIADIASSSDAQYNPTSTSPHSNGPYLFDGMLNWNNNAAQNPRGEPEDNNVGKTATVALPEGASTITIIVTISDVADTIYDSVGLIDWLQFK
jgi:hypothetical protein